MSQTTTRVGWNGGLGGWAERQCRGFMNFALFIHLPQYAEYRYCALPRCAQSRTGFVIPSIMFCAISDAVTSHITLATGLQTPSRFAMGQCRGFMDFALVPHSADHIPVSALRPYPAAILATFTPESPI